jgi:hypothetical protein
MPLKLSIASSRKIGEPNYGSRGAIVGLEMEVDSSLVDNPRQLHERIRRLFRLAKQSVDVELGCNDRADRLLGDKAAKTRPATERQRRAIQAIAAQRNLDLKEVLPGRFGVERLADLTLAQASQLIDGINAMENESISQI